MKLLDKIKAYKFYHQVCLTGAYHYMKYWEDDKRRDEHEIIHMDLPALHNDGEEYRITQNPEMTHLRMECTYFSYYDKETLQYVIQMASDALNLHYPFFDIPEYVIVEDKPIYIQCSNTYPREVFEFFNILLGFVMQIDEEVF